MKVIGSNINIDGVPAAISVSLDDGESRDFRELSEIYPGYLHKRIFTGNDKRSYVLLEREELPGSGKLRARVAKYLWEEGQKDTIYEIAGGDSYRTAAIFGVTEDMYRDITASPILMEKEYGLLPKYDGENVLVLLRGAGRVTRKSLMDLSINNGQGGFEGDVDGFLKDLETKYKVSFSSTEQGVPLNNASLQSMFLPALKSS